ncbi:ATP-binding protein [Clostridium botulinum]|uniref:Transcriptional antiterminator n=1 Tax=Clostridium botulinum C/D str. DC5 TaxID=1443128 RepID=A0A0A0IL24_CLOBO|nr:ATP-binding protein [Clostridium botulinum]KGN00947.1 transcriptional antiterminator [Clostridium botulinum C/D str. DC5]KOC52425.1 transcriptional antiterminator [Clostridium botulinum]KOC55939.1 transcriptional antiterminator [Clostridium botulinum]MCD3233280.1 ATP-binding protein [Clostridium botulinum D/C]MCD3239029.1 ATP-binding protein [Clostridium botulinum D/C]
MRIVISNGNIIILKGDTEKANYKKQIIEEYSNNPCIEALPDIFTEDDVIDRFSVIPKIDEKDKNMSSNYRYHIIKRAKNFVQPLPVHFILERRLSTLIRRGYLARNPLDKSYLERLRILNELRDDKVYDDVLLEERMSNIRSTADSMSIIGISGIGKTTAIERLLLMYPQIIKHEEYGGENFSRTQIVWLKIDCPYDGSLSTLCKSFFKAIDDLLGTRYLEKYGYANRITSTMMLHMTSLASIYGIGVLVIDEIQHLLNSKNDMEEMLNFFVTLSNTVGIPTVLIGTSKAQKIFKGNFRQARRAASEGSIIWDRMTKESDEWNFFLESLWDFQCLKENTELTYEMKNVFYDECQGITAVAVNLFILSQERALSEGKEKITVSILRTTAKEDLHMIQPMIRALRNNNMVEIMKYEDISINLDDVSINYKRDIDLIGRLEESFKERNTTVELKRRNTVENLVIELSSIGIFEELDNIEIKKLAEKLVENMPVDKEYNSIKTMAVKAAMELNEKKKIDKKIKESKKTKKQNEGLLAIYETAMKNKKHPYEVLKKEDYIKNPIDEFLMVK